MFTLIRKYTGIEKESIVGIATHEDIRQARMMSSNLMSHVLRMEHKEIAKEINRTSPSVSYHTRQHRNLMKFYPIYKENYNKIVEELEQAHEVEPGISDLVVMISNLDKRVKKLEA